MRFQNLATPIKRWHLFPLPLRLYDHLKELNAAKVMLWDF